MCVNCARVFFEMMKRSIALMGLASFVLLQSCGGGGGGGAAAEEETPATTQNVSGGGVKGPLQFAIVTAYAIDYANTTGGFKGAVVATGATDVNAAITGLSLPVPLNAPYILEFTSDAGTLDLTTGQAPVISTMRTVLTTALLSQQVYATPLTTMAVDLAITNADLNSNGTTEQEFLAALPIAAAQITSTIGFGLSSSIDIFATPPLVNDSGANLGEVASYRAAVEALTAVVYQMSQVTSATGTTPDQFMSDLVADLSDGLIDGVSNSVALPALDAAALTVLTIDPLTLTIPNTSLTVADIETTLITEAATTASSTTDTSSLVPGTAATTITIIEPTPDTDGDSILNSADNCPAVANTNQTNTDGDSFGDACDALIDSDGDGIANSIDNCPAVANPTQTNTDGDSFGDACDTLIDNDGDGIANSVDNCPAIANAAQTNTDGDSFGDACDTLIDSDGDGIADSADNCLAVANPTQTNTDGDSFGDACDLLIDNDGDGIANTADNCPAVANPAQTNTDGDSFGDACDTLIDNDGDGIANSADNCPAVANPTQTNTDGDSFGDACDLLIDNDGDGIANTADNCPNTSNADQADSDSDGVGNVCDTDLDGDGVINTADNCPNTSNANQADSDSDGVGDVCDIDSDGDGFNDNVDNCPNIANPTQTNTDGDAFGDACDTLIDNDGDGIANSADNCPAVANPAQTNTDGDSFGDACDTLIDSDGDGIADSADNCPAVANPTQTNTDGDSFGDACDTLIDNDGDGIANSIDNCPAVANPAQTNTDGDSFGDACDTLIDNDGDGIANSVDNCPAVANPAQTNTDGDSFGDACDTLIDSDGDGIADSADNCPAVANPTQTNTDGDSFGDACDTLIDSDGDTIADSVDNCPAVANTNQINTDGDSFGDACDPLIDSDGDSVADSTDNCLAVANTNQANLDGDSFGDVCDNDIDGDTVLNGADNCPTVANTNQTNTDGDSFGDACDALIDSDGDTIADSVDNCPAVANTNQTNTDGDSFGDACDTLIDSDGDTIADSLDNCPVIANTDQADNDGDGIGNVCDATPNPAVPNVQGTWRIQQTITNVTFLNGNSCNEQVGDSWASYISVVQSGTNYTMVSAAGSNFTGTVDSAGNMIFNGSWAGIYSDVSSPLSTATTNYTDTFNGTATATDTAMSSGVYTDRLSNANVGDVCDITFNYSAQKVYTRTGNEDYNGVYAIENITDQQTSPPNVGGTSSSSSTIDVDSAEFAISGTNISVYLANEGKECSEVSNNGVFDPATGAFSIDLAMDCNYSDGTSETEIGTFTGLFARAPGEAVEPSLAFEWLAVQRDKDSGGVQTRVRNNESFGYGKRVNTIGYTRANYRQKNNNQTSAAIFMGLQNAPVKTNAAGGQLYLQVLDVDGVTPLCSTPYVDDGTNVGRYSVLSRYRANPYSFFDSESFSNGAYSFVNCNTSLQDGTARVFDGNNYTVRVIDAGANNIFEGNTGDDFLIESRSIIANLNPTPYTSLVKRGSLRVDGARVSRSETGDATAVWGFFDPSEAHTITWSGSGFAETADAIIVRLQEVDDFYQRQHKLDTSALTTLPTSFTLPAGVLASYDPMNIQLRHRQSSVFVTDAVTKSIKVFPGVHGLFNIELGSNFPIDTFQIVLDGRNFSLNECFVPFGVSGLSCTGGSIDMNNNSVTINLTDGNGVFTGTPGNSFNLTLHFNNANDAEVTSNSGLPGVPSVPQGVGFATTAATVATSEFFSRTRNYSHKATNNLRTRFNANNMPSAVWDSAVLTRVDGGDIVTGIASYTLWDNAITGSTYLDRVNEFHRVPTNDGRAQGVKHFVRAETDDFGINWGLLPAVEYKLTLIDSTGVNDPIEHREFYNAIPATTMITPSMSRGDVITINGIGCGSSATVCDNVAPASITSLNTLSWPVNASVPATAWWRIIIREFDGATNAMTGQQRTAAMQSGGDLVIAGGVATWTNPGGFVLDAGKMYSIQLILSPTEQSYKATEFGSTSKQFTNVGGISDWLYFAIPGV